MHWVTSHCWLYGMSCHPVTWYIFQLINLSISGTVKTTITVIHIEQCSISVLDVQGNVSLTSGLGFYLWEKLYRLAISPQPWECWSEEVNT